MEKSPPNITPSQRNWYETAQRIRMAWTAMLFILVLLTVGFFAFLYAMFFMPGQGLATSILGGIDLLFGWSLKAIISNLFPSKKSRGK